MNQGHAPPHGEGGRGGAMAGDSDPVWAGTVKAWIDERGMGFITPDEGGEDLFVHRNDLLDGTWLSIGAVVTYKGGWDMQKNKRIAKGVTGACPAEAKGVGKGLVASSGQPP